MQKSALEVHGLLKAKGGKVQAWVQLAPGHGLFVYVEKGHLADGLKMFSSALKIEVAEMEDGTPMLGGPAA